MKIIIVIFLSSFATICFSQSTEIVPELYIPDSTDIFFSSHNDLLKSTKQKDLKYGTDSIEIRLWKSTLWSVNEMYVLQNRNNQWSSYLIRYGTVIKTRRYFGVKISKKEVDFLAKIELEPIESWNKIDSILSSCKVFEIRDQSKLDNARDFNIDDGITYTIEAASKNEYRFITWTNPKHSPKKYWDSEAVIRLSEMLKNELKEKNL
ncbi:MAG: hypothetical protein HYU68_10310 [Bacteroidetes bacterium]|nr:hypothetical protein [Bacteroidota bacterium]